MTGCVVDVLFDGVGGSVCVTLCVMVCEMVYVMVCVMLGVMVCVML